MNSTSMSVDIVAFPSLSRSLACLPRATSISGVSVHCSILPTSQVLHDSKAKACTSIFNIKIIVDYLKSQLARALAQSSPNIQEKCGNAYNTSALVSQDLIMDIRRFNNPTTVTYDRPI